MAVEDRIRCRSCGRAVVPQLWVDARDGLSHPTVRHLCPLCGATLFVSGGGVNRAALALLIVLVALSVLTGVLMLVFSRY